MCNLSQVATGARYLRGVQFGEPQRRLASRRPIKLFQMIGVVDREQVTVEEERLVLQSENWHENHYYAPLRGIIDKTLPKAQRTRGLSSTYQSNFFGSYHKFKHKS